MSGARHNCDETFELFKIFNIFNNVRVDKLAKFNLDSLPTIPKRFLVKIYPNHSTSHIHGVPELLSSERFSTLTTSEIQKPSTSGSFRAKNRIRRKGVWPRNMQKTFQIDKVPWDAVGFGFMNQMHNWRGTLIHNLAMRRKNYSERNVNYDPTWIPPVWIR